MSGIFTMVQTDAGKAAALSDGGDGVSLTFAEIAFGTGLYDTRDGAGDPLLSAQTKTALVNEVERIALTAAAPMADRQALLLATLPGGAAFEVGEIGVYLDDGTLFAVASRASAAYFTRGASETAAQFIIAWDDAEANAVTITTNGDAALALMAIDVSNLTAALDGKYDKSGGTIEGDVTVNGNLIITGTTTQVNSNEVNIGDNIIRLNAGLDEEAEPLVDAGFEVNRGAEGTVQFLWREDGDYWDVERSFRAGGNLFIGTSDMPAVSAQYAFANFGRTGTVMGYKTGNGAWFGSNYYYDGAAYRYKVSGEAHQLYMPGTGAHIMRKAEAGVAGQELTWQDVFKADSGYVMAPTKLGVGGIPVDHPIEVYNGIHRRFHVRSDGLVSWNETGPGGELTWNAGKAIVKANSTEIDLVFAVGAFECAAFSADRSSTFFGDTTVYGQLFSAGLFQASGGAKIGVQDGLDGTNERGLFLWDVDNSDYGIYCASPGAGKSLGSGTACSTLSGGTGIHIRYRIKGSSDSRSFVWENSTEQCLMSLSASSGDLNLKGSFYANGKIVGYSGAKLGIQNKEDGGQHNGVFWWDTDTSYYVDYMATAAPAKSVAGGATCPSLDNRTGLHHRSRMKSATSEGWLWENSAEECLMSLASDSGDLHLKRNVTAKACRSTSNLTVTGDYAAMATDYRLFIKRAAGAPTAITLPVGFEGAEFIVKDARGDAGTNSITITASGGALIDGAASYVIKRDRQSITVVWHDGAWHIV